MLLINVRQIATQQFNQRVHLISQTENYIILESGLEKYQVVYFRYFQHSRRIFQNVRQTNIALLFITDLLFHLCRELIKIEK